MIASLLYCYTLLYLGVHLNNKLDWTDNTEAIYKKGQSRLFLLRRLRSFGVQGELLKTFFDSVVASAIFYGVVCWGSSISTADRKRLDKLIRKASSVLGIPLDTVQEVGERRMVTKLSSLLENASHPLYETVTSLSSSFSNRLIHPKCLKERYRRSFLPAAIRLYNQSCSQ
ncbi:gastrula zinc finger protein XlCGF28.1-like [Silurus meridionalis]|nr:gastrula zinc finger protein XlCGF28.1-like [Silurus meridionalis]